MRCQSFCLLYFFFNDTATTEIYTLSLHDALPISVRVGLGHRGAPRAARRPVRYRDRKSTRLNSSHVEISYAVFCLKQKKKTIKEGQFPDQKYIHRRSKVRTLKA